MKRVGLVLASGSGSRLYPISTEDKPKQFCQLVGSHTMLKQTIERYSEFVDTLYVTTLKKYEGLAKEDTDHPLLVEPQKNESGFSILFSLLHLEKQCGDCLVIQTPSDHFMLSNGDFEWKIQQALDLAENFPRVVAVGIEPTRSDSSYGYMRHANKVVTEFVEKPSEEQAGILISQGALWNTAIYVYRLRTLLDSFTRWNPFLVGLLRKPIQENDVELIKELYRVCRPFQFEKEVMKLVPLHCLKTNAYWDDIGTHERLERVRELVDELSITKKTVIDNL